MAIFLTGATGYIGSYLAAGLLEQHGESLNLLVRAADHGEAQRRLWHSLQLHFDFPAFREHLSARIRIFRGDLTAPRFGLADDTDCTLHSVAQQLNLSAERVRQIQTEALSKLRGILQADHGTGYELLL